MGLASRHRPRIERVRAATAVRRPPPRGLQRGTHLARRRARPFRCRCLLLAPDLRPTGRRRSRPQPPARDLPGDFLGDLCGPARHHLRTASRGHVPRRHSVQRGSREVQRRAHTGPRHGRDPPRVHDRDRLGGRARRTHGPIQSLASVGRRTQHACRPGRGDEFPGRRAGARQGLWLGPLRHGSVPGQRVGDRHVGPSRAQRAVLGRRRGRQPPALPRRGDDPGHPRRNRARLGTAHRRDRRRLPALQGRLRLPARPAFPDRDHARRRHRPCVRLQRGASAARRPPAAPRRDARHRPPRHQHRHLLRQRHPRRLRHVAGGGVGARTEQRPAALRS